MDDQAISRVHYFERQFLRTQDFSDEQAYHLAMSRRHKIAHHTWGIVSGLELMLDPDCNPIIAPGFAVDGYGRELVMADRQAIEPRAFDARGSDVLRVWLAYNQSPADQTVEGGPACRDLGTADLYRRVAERPLVFLEPPNPAFPDPRAPEWVPTGDLTFDATRTPPDKPESFWPVYLGQVTRKRDKVTDPYKYTISLSDRPYAGLVGEAVYHPAGHARVEIGTGADDNTRRFAVFLTDPPTTTAHPDQGATGGADPRLEITSDGEMTVRGDATLYGNLALAAGALWFEAETDEAKVEPVNPRPWALYRVTNAGNAKSTTHDLRVELAGKTKGLNQLVIGAWRKGADGKEAFQPCLTVDDNCHVTVSGNLIVEGYITKTGGGAGPASPQAQAFLSSTYSSATAASGAQALAALAGPFGVTTDQLVQMLESGTGRDMLVDLILPNSNRRHAFILALLDRPYQEPTGQTTGQAAVIGVLLETAARRGAVINALVSSTDARGETVDAVLASANGRKTLVDKLVANAAKALEIILPDILLTLDGRKIVAVEVTNDPAARRATLAAIAQDVHGVADIVDALDAATKLPAVVTAVLGKPTGADAIVSAVGAATPDSKALMDKLLDSSAVRDLLSGELATDDTRITNLGTAIKNTFGAGSHAMGVLKTALGL